LRAVVLIEINVNLFIFAPCYFGGAGTVNDVTLLGRTINAFVRVAS